MAKAWGSSEPKDEPGRDATHPFIQRFAKFSRKLWAARGARMAASAPLFLRQFAFVMGNSYAMRIIEVRRGSSGRPSG
jgi:hypothetical protein